MNIQYRQVDFKVLTEEQGRGKRKEKKSQREMKYGEKPWGRGGGGGGETVC